MASTSTHSPDTGVGEPESKKRKIRKGTQSCWECKRRKIRCTFAVPTNDVCDGCTRRRTRCIGQEYHDNPGPADNNRHLEDRLSKIEMAIEQFKKEIPKLSQQNVFNVNEEPQSRIGAKADSTASMPFLASSNLGPSFHDSRLEDRMTEQGYGGLNRSLPPAKPQVPMTHLPPASQGSSMHETHRHKDVCRALYEAWPTSHDLQLISNARIGILGLPHMGLCSLSGSDSQEVGSPRDLLQLPPPGSHPVFIARKLLVLGSFLQAILPYAATDLVGLSTNCQNIMSRAVEAAISQVTSNDWLVGSIEGIECIMIEAMYHNSAGNLRRAWLTTRRSMVIAQMMGLQRGNNPISFKVLNLKTRSKMKPMDIWFRIVQADRYFSLVLGLPQGCVDNSFATTQELEKCTPIEYMQRIDCVAAGRILQRNSTGLHDLEATKEIDKLLQKASASMPPQWWLIPDLSSSATDEKKVFLDTVRLMDQCAHYILLAQLHLPFMLRFPEDRKYDHSKITAVNASREVLSRFTAFRSLNLAGYYCRGLDFLAFIASTVLCLAHINSHGHYENYGDPVLAFLAHQRSSDRGMMERALEALDNMIRQNMDAVSSKIASIFRHLLAIESDAANGSRYSTDTSSRSNEQEFEHAGTVSDGGKVLNIYVPYFGTVKIEHGSVSKSVPTKSGSLDDGSATLAPESPSNAYPYDSTDATVLLDSIDEALRTRPATKSTSLLSEKDKIGPTHEIEEQTKTTSANLKPGSSWDQFMTPDLSASVDDWALQGVDMAFFDSIIRGMGDFNAADGDTWGP